MATNTTDISRSWWECAPRQGWTARIEAEQPEIVKRQGKRVSDALITMETQRLAADNGCPRKGK